MKSKAFQLSCPTVFFLTIFLLFGACSPCNYIPMADPPPPPEFCVPERIRVALVLGSGGVRGMAHIGVLEELEAAGIPIDLIVGCSAGSIVGALYADNPCAEDIKCAVWSIKTRSMLDIEVCNCRFGLSQDYSMKRVLRQHLGADCFEDLQIPLVIVATDLHTGELVPIGAGNLAKAVQASCSMPFVFVPCKHMGRVFVDGGVINPVPAKVARDLGAEFIIAVDLCELLPKTFPTNLFGVAARSAEIAMMWQNEVCTRDADVVIRPKTCDVGTFNEGAKWEIYQAGKNAARELIPLIKKLVEPILADRYCPPGQRCVCPTCYTPDIYLDSCH